MKSKIMALASGFAVVVLVFALANFGLIESRTAETLLFPGLFIGSRLGYGAHDLGLFGVILIVGSVAYGAVAFGLFYIIGGLARHRSK